MQRCFVGGPGRGRARRGRRGSRAHGRARGHLRPLPGASRSMSGTLAGKRVLVTAGGTREPLDAVRYIGNRSSGRMGVALAAEARRRGAEVTLIASNLTVPAPDDVEVVDAPTAAEVETEAPARPAADVATMAGAGP